MSTPELTLNQYQNQASSTAIYPDRGTIRGLEYCALGACGESGEIANKVKKIFRDDGSKLISERREMIRKEIGGVLWYLSQVCEEMNTTLSSCAEENLAELVSRKTRGTLNGDGDNR